MQKFIEREIESHSTWYSVTFVVKQAAVDPHKSIGCV